MKRMLILVAVLSALCIAPGATSRADEVQLDFLGGWGSFEQSGDVRWTSCYAGNDYDWSTQTGWSSQPSGGYRWGYSRPSTDDNVGIGWIRETGSSVNPGTNVVYRLVDDAGVAGSKCQYFALKNTVASGASAMLNAEVAIGTGPYDVHAGDTIVIDVDYYNVADTSAPATYALQTYPWTDSVPLSPSAHSASLEVEVPTGSSYIAPMLRIQSTGSLEGDEAGLYVDNVRVRVRRNGSYLTCPVPVESNRAIRTMKIDFDPIVDGLYETARDYDHVVLRYEENSKLSARLKYFNPAIKVYVREPAGSVLDLRWANQNDDWHVQAPFSYKYALDNHPEWMYEDPNNLGSYLKLGYVSYYARLTDSLYRTTWEQKAAEKLGWYHADGLFTDDLAVVSSLPRAADQLQTFVHTVAPDLRESGLTLIQDIGAYNTDAYPAAMLVDPTWQTNTTYSTSAGYADNSPTLTADAFSQQSSFFKKGWYQSGANWFETINYDQSYWLKCLGDMDAVAAWNAGISETDLKKRMHCRLAAIDNTSNPASGVNGWLHYGLCSYLLGQNDWTTFGAVRSDGSSFDLGDEYTLTTDLGVPAGGHEPLSAGDPYFRCRRFYGTDGGARGGIVLANANPWSGAFQPDIDMYDENGTLVPAGSTFLVSGRTGRVLAHYTNLSPVLSVLNPQPGEVIKTNTYTIQGFVAVNRPEATVPSTVQLTIDGGTAVDCSVDANNNWSFEWSGYAEGSHTIVCSAQGVSSLTRTVTYDCTFDTIAKAEMMADGVVARLLGKRVTATNAMLTDSIYIQDESGRGLRIAYSGPSSVTDVGETINVIGTLATVSGERCISSTTVTSASHDKTLPDAYAMPNKSLGGADWQYDATTGRGQRGVTDAYGWNNIGQLVKTWGAVLPGNTTSFYIGDHSQRGLIEVVVPAGVSYPAADTYVAVVGISSFGQVEVRQQSDIQVLEADPTPATLQLAAGDNWIGLPVVAANPDPAVLFANAHDSIDGRLSRYEPLDWCDYIYPQSPMSFGYMVLGQGYRLTQTDVSTISYSGYSDGITTTPGCRTNMVISLPGDGGYFSVASPFSYDVPVDDGSHTGNRLLIATNTDAPLMTWGEASDQGWCDSYMAHMSPDETWSTLTYQDWSGVENVMRAGYAYDFCAYSSNMALIVPEIVSTEPELQTDRGLSSNNVNSHDANRSNIKWADNNPNVAYGDDFTLATGDWTIDRITVWTIPTVPGYSSYALGDHFSSVTLYKGGATGALTVAKTGTLTAGSNAVSGTDITITPTTYPGGADYERPDGGFDQMWRIDFANLNWQVTGDTINVFGVYGAPRVDRLWFNAASHDTPSGDGHVRRFDVTDLSDGAKVVDPSGWFAGKGSDINVQIFAHRRNVD